MFRTLQSKLLFSFVVLSLISILLMSIAFRFAFEDCFTIYLDNKRENEIQRFVTELKNQPALYASDVSEQADLNLNAQLSTLLSYQAMTEGLFYEVYNQKKELLLDSTDLIERLSDINPNGYSGETANHLNLSSELRGIEVNGQKLGTITVYYKLGYNQGEFQFKDRLNKYIVAAEGTMVVISIIISLLFSRRLTVGLQQIRNAAQELLKHNLNVRMPVKNSSEEMMLVAASFNELAESLTYQEKLRKQFTSDLAHEFRTPIATLRSQIESFQDKIFEPTPERLDQCHNELMRLTHLVGDLEELMIAENPKLKLKMTTLCANEMLEKLAKSHRATFEKKDISFLIQKSPEDLFFNLDKNRFNQIMCNLLTNCYKYTPEGGTVIVGVNRKGDRVNLYVKDTGVGITKEDLPHVFERFYRGDKSRDRKTGGIGIGLSIVKALITAQNGTITIDSVPEEGTTISITFPLSNI